MSFRFRCITIGYSSSMQHLSYSASTCMAHEAFGSLQPLIRGLISVEDGPLISPSTASLLSWRRTAARTTAVSGPSGLLPGLAALLPGLLSTGCCSGFCLGCRPAYPGYLHMRRCCSPFFFATFSCRAQLSAIWLSQHVLRLVFFFMTSRPFSHSLLALPA